MMIFSVLCFQNLTKFAFESFFLRILRFDDVVELVEIGDATAFIMAGRCRAAAMFAAVAAAFCN